MKKILSTVKRFRNSSWAVCSRYFRMKGFYALSVSIMITILSSKMLIYYKYGFGFIIAAFGSTLTMYKYFKRDKTRLLGFLEIPIILSFFLMYYEWIKFGEQKDPPSFSQEKWTGIVIILVLLIWWCVRTAKKKKTLVARLEAVSAICFAIGGIFITLQLKMGWLFWLFAHIALAWHQHIKKDYAFELLQIISIIIALSAIIFGSWKFI